MERILLRSRYGGEDRFLSPFKENWWKFSGCEYVRFISGTYPDRTGIWAFDPEGGPFTEVGTLLNSNENKQYKVVEIRSTKEEGLLVKLEEIK